MKIDEYAAKLNPQDEAPQARRACAVGHRAFFKGSSTDAISAFSEAIQNDPQWALPFNDLARVFMKVDDDGSAVSYYQQALQLDPKWVYLQLNLARVFSNETSSQRRNQSIAERPKWTPRSPRPGIFWGRSTKGRREKQKRSPHTSAP